MHIAAGILRALCKPAPAGHGFQTLRGWVSDLQKMGLFFSGGSGPFTESLAAKAEQFSVELSESIGASALIHGDFHPENILSARREPWLAIDPKGWWTSWLTTRLIFALLT